MRDALKLKKNGKPALPRVGWEVGAGTRREIANELGKIVTSYESAAEEGISAALENKAIGAEVVLAFSRLLNELRALRIEHMDSADEWKRFAERARRGRPATKQKDTPSQKYTSNAFAAVFHGIPYKARPRRGRPAKNGIDADLLVYADVEQWREKMTKNKTVPTIKAAIESIIADRAGKDRRSFAVSREELFNKMRSQYIRGKKASEA